MKRKIYLGIGVAALVAAVVLWLAKENAALEIAPLTVLNPSQLRLTLAWNGESVPVAPPAVLPQSILDSKEFRVWRRVGNATRFVGRDDKGNEVVATAMGISTDAKGVRRPVFPSIKALSPAGVLINETMYSPEGVPVVWTVYGPDSKKVQKVEFRESGKPGTPFIRQVTFFDSGEQGRQYASDNPEGIVWAEWAVDSEGVIQRAINGGKPELVAAFIKQKELAPDGAATGNQFR